MSEGEDWGDVPSFAFVGGEQVGPGGSNLVSGERSLEGLMAYKRSTVGQRREGAPSRHLVCSFFEPVYVFGPRGEVLPPTVLAEEDRKCQIWLGFRTVVRLTSFQLTEGGSSHGLQQR